MLVFGRKNDLKMMRAKKIVCKLKRVVFEHSLILNDPCPRFTVAVVVAAATTRG